MNKYLEKIAARVSMHKAMARVSDVNGVRQTVATKKKKKKEEPRPRRWARGAVRKNK